MRIAHLSDLHFGRHDPRIAEALLQDLQEQNPHIVVVSGDFTQVGSRAEFRQARAFLDRINRPVFAVPGNHDVPALDIVSRLINPYERYRKFIADDLEPTMIFDHVMLIGVKTSRRMQLGWNWANGSISTAQLRSVSERLTQAPRDIVPIVVAHHPLVQPEQALEKPMRLVKRADNALAAFADMGVRLVMSGHFHRSYRREHNHPAGAKIVQRRPTKPMIVLQAASAISTRLRDDRNGYNLVEVQPDHIDITVREWSDTGWLAVRETDIVRHNPMSRTAQL